MQTIRTHTGDVFGLPINAYRDLPNLDPITLTSVLVLANPTFDSEIFSKANLVSVYRSLSQKYFAETVTADLAGKKLKEAIQEFRSWFWSHFYHVYLVLRSCLGNVPSYHIYRFNSGSPLSGKELCSWIIHEINFTAPWSPQSEEPVVDVFGPLYDGAKEDLEANRRRAARVSRMLLVALPVGARSDDGVTLSHLHISQTHRLSNTQLGADIGISPEPTIALEFPDHATKVLAKLALENVTWRLGEFPWCEFVVQDYPEQHNIAETLKTPFILSMPRSMRLADLCLRILSILPHHDYHPCYEFASAPKALGTTDYTRLLVEDCPPLLHELFAGSPLTRGPLYVTASPMPNCRPCRKIGVHLPEYLPELRDRRYEMDFSDGFFANLVISIDQTFLLNQDDQDRGNVIGIPSYLRPPTDKPLAQGFHTVNTNVDAETFYTNHKTWIMKDFPDASTEDKVAVFRQVKVYGSKPIKTLVDVLAGRFTRWLHGEEELQANAEYDS